MSEKFNAAANNAAIVLVQERLLPVLRDAGKALASAVIIADNGKAAMRAALETIRTDNESFRFSKANPKISEKGLDELGKTARLEEIERRKVAKCCPLSRAVWLRLIAAHPGKGTLTERMQYASDVISRLNRELKPDKGKKPGASRVSIVVSGEEISGNMLAAALADTLTGKHAMRFATLATFLEPALAAYEAAMSKGKKPPSKRKAPAKAK